MSVPEVKIGQSVVYHLPDSQPVEALVICVFQNGLINLAYVDPDANRQDSYGRQISRATSCMHKSASSVHGNYWRLETEESNPVVQPVAS